MRFLPRSLFGRLALLLLLVIPLAQIISTTIQIRDRSHRLLQASGQHSAERISGIILLLEAASDEERVHLLNVLDVPPLNVSLTNQAEPIKEQPAETSAPEEEFRTRLRNLLGNDYQIRVAISDIKPVITEDHNHKENETMGMSGMHGTRHMQDMGIMLPDTLVFYAQVRLKDGNWVNFENRIPKEILKNTDGLIWTLAILLVSALGISLLVVRWATQPLSRLARAADNLGYDINQEKIPEQGPVEVIHASRAFNNMQSRLQRYIADRTRLLSAISHDLRTPITRMRLRAEMMDDEETRNSFIRNLDEMQAITSETLDFLQGMEKDENIQPLDVNALLDSLREDAAILGQDVEIDSADIQPFAARPHALKRCLSNLIENAVKYTGHAHVRVTDSNDALIITVSDNGPGIPDEQIDAVFEPFFRLENSRNRDTGGTGLGLSIARNIALAHGGELQLKNRESGGLDAVLTLYRRR